MISNQDKSIENFRDSIFICLLIYVPNSRIESINLLMCSKLAFAKFMLMLSLRLRAFEAGIYCGRVTILKCALPLDDAFLIL